MKPSRAKLREDAEAVAHRAALVARIEDLASDHVHHNAPPRWADAVLDQLGHAEDLTLAEVELPGVLEACEAARVRTCDPDATEDEDP